MPPQRNTDKTKAETHLKQHRVYANKEQKATLREAFYKAGEQLSHAEVQRLEKETGLTEAWIRRWVGREQRKIKIAAVKEEEKEAQLVHASPDPVHHLEPIYNHRIDPSHVFPPLPIQLSFLPQNVQHFPVKLEAPESSKGGLSYNTSNRLLPRMTACLSSISPPPSPSLYARQSGSNRVQGKVTPQSYFPSSTSLELFQQHETPGRYPAGPNAFPSHLQPLLTHLPCITSWLDAQTSHNRHPSVAETVDQLLALNQTLIVEDLAQAAVALLFVNRAGISW